MSKNTMYLHPRATGDSALATISFEDRAMVLQIETFGHGHVQTSLSVNFDSPNDIRKLALSLLDLASEAEAYFKVNP
jgi:hypothetical protein